MSNKQKKIIKANIQDWLRERGDRAKRRAKLTPFNPIVIKEVKP